MINVSSGLAFVPFPSLPIYCASKAAIHSYTQSLRFQLEELGIEIIELMPPAVKTDLTADLRGRQQPDHYGRVSEGFLCVSQDWRPRDPAWAILMAGAYASPRPRFHQQAVLEGVQEDPFVPAGVG